MKRAAVLSVFIAAGVALSGCSKGEAVSASSAPSSDAQSIYVMQAGDTQVTGEVTEIIGNEVTLALGDVSQDSSQRELPEGEGFPGGEGFPQAGDGEGFPQTGDGEGFPQGQRENGGGFSGREFGEGFQRGDSEGFPQREGGQGFPQQRGDGGGSPQMGGGMGGGRTRGSSASIEKNGDTASYLIPVGMTVQGASGRNSDYSAVSAGMILRLTVNADGYVVAAEIL